MHVLKTKYQIFSIETWPNNAIKILLSKYFRYRERLTLAAFFHGNGLRDHLKAERIFKFYNQYWNWSKNWFRRFEEFAALFAYLDQTNIMTGDIHKFLDCKT